VESYLHFTQIYLPFIRFVVALTKFAKKAIIGFVVSVRPSVSLPALAVKLGSHWMDFRED
jgi:hypothetical protein